MMTRFMYTTNDTRLRLVYSSTDNGSNAPSEDDARVALSSEMRGGSPASLEDPLVESMSEFKIKSYYIRAGIDYDYTNELRFGVDELFIHTVYDEVLFDRWRNVNYTQATTALYMKQQFGDFVFYN